MRKKQMEKDHNTSKGLIFAIKKNYSFRVNSAGCSWAIIIKFYVNETFIIGNIVWGKYLWTIKQFQGSVQEVSSVMCCCL